MVRLASMLTHSDLVNRSWLGLSVWHVHIYIYMQKQSWKLDSKILPSSHATSFSRLTDHIDIICKILKDETDILCAEFTSSQSKPIGLEVISIHSYLFKSNFHLYQRSHTRWVISHTISKFTPWIGHGVRCI